MFLLWHPWLTTTNLSYSFPLLETSATALCGTTGRKNNKHINIIATNQSHWWGHWRLLISLHAPPDSPCEMKHVKMTGVKMVIHPDKNGKVKPCLVSAIYQLYLVLLSLVLKLRLKDFSWSPCFETNQTTILSGFVRQRRATATSLNFHLHQSNKCCRFLVDVHPAMGWKWHPPHLLAWKVNYSILWKLLGGACSEVLKELKTKFEGLLAVPLCFKVNIHLLKWQCKLSSKTNWESYARKPARFSFEI